MKNLLRMLAVGLTLIFLTGCATVQLNVRVNSDGTGEKEMLFAMDKEMLSLASSDGTDPLAALQDELKQEPDVTITRYEEGDRVGFKAVAPFNGSATLDDKAWKGSFTTKDSLFWRDYKLDLDADLNMEELENDPMASAILSKVDFGVTFELPTKVSEHNGQVDASGKKVTWKLVPGRKDHLTLQAREYHTGRLVGAGVGVLLILGGGGLLIARRKKASSTAESDVA